MIPRRLFWAFDFAVFSLAFSIAYRITPKVIPLIAPRGPLSWIFKWMSRPPWAVPVPPAHEHVWILLTVVLTGMVALTALGAHRSLLEQSLLRIVISSILAPLAGLGLITLVLFALKSTDWSRLFVFSFVGLSAIGLLSYRVILRAYVLQRLRSGFYARNVLLAGTREAVALLAEAISCTTSQGERRLLGYLRVGDPVSTEKPLALPCLGDVHQLSGFLIRRPIHEVVAAQPTTNGEWLPQVVLDCDQVGVPLRIVPEPLIYSHLKTLQILHPPLPMTLPAVALAPLRRESDAVFVKRLIDIALSGLILIILAPVFALIALAVKLSSPGPALYPWRVIGEQGREFTGYKFRTMVQDADARKAELLEQNEMSGPVFKMRYDPRVTPVGRLLRKYSLDELPQLWSVLKGDMSLVGPRPAFRSELERYEFWQMRKLSARPGITCLWQVRGRNGISNFNDWVKLDLEYIDNWSLWLDLKILVRTAWVVLAGTGR